MKTSRFYLEDMRDYAKTAIEFAGAGHGPDRGMRQLALERCFEIVGEAARNVEPEIVIALRDIEFREAIDMRNRIAHGYDTISLLTLLETARRDLPRLIVALEAALAGKLPDDPA